ncbi:MAG: DUF4332 domain-containing protein [Ignavibacteriae bacterium]|nr:DUF4332 domain-containing protein [Ignavibacteriota bacterium]MCB9217168.1 DUF4332 domain-containing protein [Ignavibacteria bacterium]
MSILDDHSSHAAEQLEWRVSDLPMLRDGYADKLASAGITSFRDILSLATGPSDRRKLAQDLHMEETWLWSAVTATEMAVTLKLDKLTWQLLVNNGVYDARELGRCICSQLHRKLLAYKPVNHQARLTVPSIGKLQNLIDAALVSPRLITK